MIVGGFLAERGDRLVAAALGFAALMSAVLASGAMPPLALWPLMAAMGFGVGMAGPGRDLLVRRAATSRFGRSSFGRVYGFVYSGLDTGQALSPVLFGPLLDAGRFRQALVAVARAPGIGAVLRAARRQPGTGADIARHRSHAAVKRGVLIRTRVRRAWVGVRLAYRIRLVARPSGPVSNAICLSLTFAKNFFSLSANTSNFGPLMVWSEACAKRRSPSRVISRMRFGVT